MTLRMRTLLFLGITLIVLLVALYFVAERVLTRGFGEVEHAQVEANLVRVRHAIENELDTLAASNRDYSSWSVVYDFVSGGKVDYTEITNPEAVQNLGADTFVILDRDGEVLAQTLIDPENGSEIAPSAEMQRLFSPGSALIPELGEQRTGIVQVDEKPFLFASLPILRDDGSGPPTGTLVLGKSLTSAAVDALSELTFLDIDLHLLTFGRPDTELSMILSQLYNSAGDSVIQVFDANRIGGYLLLRDVSDAPIAVVGVVEPRPIAAQGRMSTRYLFFGLLFLGSASGVIAGLLLEWLVLRRVGLLSEQVTTIADSGEIERRVAVQGTDELARLGSDINNMLTTLERVQVKLRTAEEEAIEANTAKSRFLANMSHEIRTPLNAVMGMTNLLRESELTAEQREYVETIYQGSESLLTIISDILDLSKIESGKLELEAEPLNLRTCVELTLDIMAARAREKHLELLYRMNPDVPEAIRSDITRLRQILLNLLSNAIKFTDHGEVIVTVHTGGPSGATKDGHLLLHFTVTDTGIGIPPERIDRLFRPFSQIDASTTRKYGGTGLGLAISRRLVELMGGEMWVESSGVPGDGSAFHFTIATTPAETLRPDYLTGQQPHLLGKRALIVDDNTNNRRTLLRQIQQWGMTGLTTGSPLEALDWLRQREHFDVALLDMYMDELDGKELAQAIRRVEEEQEIGRLPLLILSSSTSRESDAQALAIFATLSKPVKLGTLYDALRRLFGSPDAPGDATNGAPAHKRTLAEHYPLRVLLAEDNLVNQKLAQRLLKRLGYNTDVAEDGQQALDMVSAIAYDVVLMDVQMPALDGLDATRRIRTKLPPDDQPYIIAMTANAMIGDREACLAAGMNAYIAKPIQFAELDGAIEAAAVARQHA